MKISCIISADNILAPFGLVDFDDVTDFKKNYNLLNVILN
jgi:hypothetical protein